MQMNKNEFTWTYVGKDAKYCGYTFTCTPGTALVDDIVILAIKSHVFFLEKIQEGNIYGYYVRKCGRGERTVPHIRTPGHVRPCDDFIKANPHCVENTADSTSANSKGYSLRAGTSRPMSYAVKRKTPTKRKWKEGKYYKKGGGLIDPVGKRSVILPLSTEESKRLRSGEVSEPTEDTTTFVYQVRAYKDGTHESGRPNWIYVGRRFNQTREIFLTVEWLNDNHMKGPWRQRTILRKENYWFRVAVEETTHATQRGGCIPLSIIKFYNHVGMVDLASRVETRLSNGIKQWLSCINFIYRSGGFLMTKPALDVLDRVLLVEGKRKVLFVLQIAAGNETNQDIDNSHALCVFDGLIFDANHSDPLPLTKDNLNACCVGGPNWTFHHVSRARQFSPSKKSRKLFPIFREVKKDGMNNSYMK